MSILPKLIAAYRNAGYEPVTGHNPHHFGGWMDAPFTRFIKDNVVHGTAGLALQEIMFLEGFAQHIAPKRILVIGNAHGWSTIALSMIFPDATVAALDPSQEGNALTNGIAAANGLSITAATGFSPQDVPSLCAARLGGQADLILIDAVHTNEAMLADFEACKAVSHEGTLTVFHDVVNWGMVDAFKTIRRDNQLEGHVLTRTPSGMAVVWKRIPDSLRAYVEAFTDDPRLFALYRAGMISRYGDPVSATLGKL